MTQTMIEAVLVSMSYLGMYFLGILSVNYKVKK